jgi:hypothetical protein
MAKNLIMDTTNLLYRVFFASNKDADAKEIITGLCNQSALLQLKYHYDKHKPDNVVLAFDSYSWRKEYTKDLSTCITNKKYKGNRRKNLTESQEQMMKKFDEHVDEFYELIKNKTRIITLRGKYLEADDLIAGYVQMNKNDDNIIISADKDFVQLMSNPRVKLIDPIKDKERDLSEWNDDARFHIFEKCFRGDASDNVQSSYPRLRKNKIEEAYKDDYVFNTLMKNKFTSIEMINNSPIEIEYITEELFEENEMLMDLTKQPKPIKKMIKKVIQLEENRDKKYNHYAFMRFCVKHQMERITTYLSDLAPVLKNKPFPR